MDELLKAYIDAINDFDPYWESYEDPREALEIELPEMLYNLEEISENLSYSLYSNYDEDLDRCNKHIKKVIKLFKSKGVTIK